jgi:hypothetical protein
MGKIFMLVLLCALTFASLVLGGQLPDGEKLFADTSLGTNGQSCASCHPGGKGLAEVGAYDTEMLQEMVNFCIRDAMKGQLLPEGAPELVALEKYLRSFQQK